MADWRWFTGVGPVVVLAIVAACIWGFISLAEQVVEGDVHQFDETVVLLFREGSDPAELIGPRWFEDMMRDITALGSYAIVSIVIILAVIYLLLIRRRSAAVLVAVSVLGGTTLSTLLKLGFDRPRPDLASTAHVFTASFPSGHALLSAVTFLTIGALLARQTTRRRLRLFFVGAAVLLTMIVGLSRVYLGVHYPTDVLAGWSLGAAWALLCTLIAAYLQRQGTVNAPGGSTAPGAEAEERPT